MIVIVGAGIAGLASAMALARHGDVLVLERRSVAAANAGAGIQLSPNAVKALAALNLRDQVAAVAQAPSGLVVRAAGRPRPLTTLDYGAVARRFAAPSLTAARADLHGALVDAVSALPNVEVRHDVAVSVPRQGPAGWCLGEVDGPVRFLVAADGVNSVVRAALSARRHPDEPVESGYVAWRGVGLERDASVVGGDGDGHGNRGRSLCTTLSLATGRHVVRYPAVKGANGESRTNLVLVAAETDRHPSTMDGPVREAVADVADWTPWPIKVRRRHAFGQGCLALVGDAAHAMTPFLAQGGAMALEDAAVLGAAVGQHGLTPAATEAYATARRPRLRRLASQSERQRLVYHLASPLSLARDAVMQRLGAEAILAQVAWIYDWTAPS